MEQTIETGYSVIKMSKVHRMDSTESPYAVRMP